MELDCFEHWLPFLDTSYTNDQFGLDVIQI